MFKFVGKVVLGTVVVMATLYVMDTPERIRKNKLAKAEAERVLKELEYRREYNLLMQAAYDRIRTADSIKSARADSVRKVEQARYAVMQKDHQITEQCRYYAATQVEEEQAYRDCVIGKSARGKEIKAGKNLVQL